MSATSVQQRYEEFQEQAVASVVSDFTKKPNGRFLLVIPTGGGKTFTAVKSVNRLYEVGVLERKQDRVLWTAHRIELLTQAKDTFAKLKALNAEKPTFPDHVDFVMIGKAEAHVQADHNVKLVVIDEAHHAALKNISYGPLFALDRLGILGLTATPSRHDGESLDFERESFSIGFPDLVKRGIVLKPEVRRVVGGTFDFSDLHDASLEQLNVEERNKNIIDELLAHTDEYKKVIVYLGTINHVTCLYQRLLKSPLKGKYDSISYVTGNENSRGQDRETFFAEEKRHGRAILLNVAVLTEGYDDPSVNTVVMAIPSRSKLYYMQAMGRAIRRDPEDELKKAFCVEVDDDLPNVRYRIDNRWLFSDVSDALEPAVEDRTYGTAHEFVNVLAAIYKLYDVPTEFRLVPLYDKEQRYTILLFKKYLAPGKYAHFPIVIDNHNRLQVHNVFNYLSERMAVLTTKGVVAEAAFRMVGSEAFEILPGENERRWVYEALTAAVLTATNAMAPSFIVQSAPWITFVALHYYQEALSEELLAFTSEMVNRDELLASIKCRDFVSGSFLIRLPLPLSWNIGKIVNQDEFAAIDLIVKRLRNLRNVKGHQDHRSDLHAIMIESVIPIELAHVDSLVLIARTDEPYSLQLL